LIGTATASIAGSEGVGEQFVTNSLLPVFTHTVGIAAVTSTITVLISGVVGVALLSSSKPVSDLVILSSICSYGTLTVVRTMGFILGFGPDSTLSLVWEYTLGAFYDAPFTSSGGGLITVLVHIFLPAAILGAANAAASVDQKVTWAAKIAGASKWRQITNIILPSMLPSLLGSGGFSFLVSLGVFIVPSLIGGSASGMISVVVVEEINSAMNYERAFALAGGFAILSAVFFGILGLMNALLRGRYGGL
jgi:ABC-type spermidine/putrescine transport system permease subunit I